MAAGQSEAMFGIAYGEYEISFEFPGRRAGPGQATVSIIYRDEGHRTDTLMASAPLRSEVCRACPSRIKRIRTIP